MTPVLVSAEMLLVPFWVCLIRESKMEGTIIYQKGVRSVSNLGIIEKKKTQ